MLNKTNRELKLQLEQRDRSIVSNRVTIDELVLQLAAAKGRIAILEGKPTYDGKWNYEYISVID